MLFGGYVNGVYLADTWEWDGATWTQRAVTGPVGRASAALVCDSDHGLVYMNGGYDLNGTGAGILSDTWAWNGNEWTLVSTNGPPADAGRAGIYDSPHHSTFFLGGFGFAVDGYRAVWSLRNESPIIYQHPESQLAHSGDSLSLSVAIDASTNPALQWRRNGATLVDDDRITGSTTSALHINPVSPSDSGVYDAVITCSCGTSRTRGAVITVLCDASCCYPNCDRSTAQPLLTANDFQCFLNAFSSGDPYANCDGSSVAPVLTANDFQCFLNAFAAGCV